MPISWNEIRDRSFLFSKEWGDESSEIAEAQSFWNDFFNIFGITRRRVASFEKPVTYDDGKGGFIDLLWKGVLLVEHKSLGKNLDSAYGQALDYFPGLKERELPQYVIVSDFERFRLYNLDEDIQTDFLLKDLHQNIHLFGFIAGYQTHSFEREDPVNIKAAEALGHLHDRLLENNYKGHALEVLLVRLLFCLFAEDSGIFEKSSFQDYIDFRTSEDGSDLGMHLANLFQVLDREVDRRQNNLDEQLAAFPFIDGKLFEETLPVAAFTSQMRESLLNCCALDWSRISPAIFGSLFQSIMYEDARRNLGAHYTTESNILKVLKPLFLDKLYAEFNRVKRYKQKLIEFHIKLSNINILDPACGCGNFLAIAYRELRILELYILRNLYHPKKGMVLNIEEITLLNVDQFYGIELEEFPAQIAQVALWLTDHQMNMRISEEFGQYFVRLPFRKSPNIFFGDALKYEWNEIIEPGLLNYIVGNPPYVGKAYQNSDQKKEITNIFRGIKGSGILDYVACWYKKAADYMQQNKSIEAAYVSTNSITQGEQVGILWPSLLLLGVNINFAHRTFQWTSEASGVAAVHVVIIGFSFEEQEDKYLYEYDKPLSDAHRLKVVNINPYLVDAPFIWVKKRRQPICDIPEMNFGSMPNDGGYLLLNHDEKSDILTKEPELEPYIKKIIGSREFINGIERYCFWLINTPPHILRHSNELNNRLKKVKEIRLESSRATTRRLAAKPALFGEIRQPDSDYIAVPEVSSERRTYIPIGLLDKEVIATNKIYQIPEHSLFDFGIIQSLMHMVWIKTVSGRLKSDIQYSAGLVYNNFPWPVKVSKKDYAQVEKLANKIISTRKTYLDRDSTLADIYDPLYMPEDLLKAHHKLDKAVDKCYRSKKFDTERNRIEFLFNMYVNITGDLIK